MKMIALIAKDELLRGRITDIIRAELANSKDKIIAEKDKQIAELTARIEELEAALDES